MRTMTWEEIEKDWGGLQKRHRMEIAQAVARYCIGHDMKEVGHRLSYSHDWVVNQLDYAGVGMALGGGGIKSDLPLTGSTNNVAKEVPRLIREYGPAVTVQVTSDDDNEGCVIESIEGDDAEAFEPYLNHYTNEGHTPAAATRLAKAEWAAEAAVEAGVIQESKSKAGERVNKILFPEDESDTFELSLRHHTAHVEAAARFLDTAKVPHLRRKSTCEKVASANAKWIEQVDRIRNFHSTFDKVV